MSAVLAALLLLNAAFVLALLWGALVFLPTAVALVYWTDVSLAADFLRFPVPVPVYLGLAAAFLVGQFAYGYRRVLSNAGTGGGDDTELDRLVTQLAMAADVSPPDTRVLDDETPSCYTLGRVTDATIVVTTGLLETLDGDELAAVLAHELAHVANRDVTLMTVTALFLEITNRVYHAVRLPRRALADFESLSRGEQLAVQYLSVLVVGVDVLVWPVLWLFPVVARAATQTLAHTREFAADAAGARITGDPLALATALIALDDGSRRPGRDLRASQMHALCVVPAPLVTGRAARRETVENLVPSPNAASSKTTASRAADGESTTTTVRDDRVVAWLDGRTATQAGASSTHPPTAARVERLREIAEDLKG
jgi:Zn-dependent protease with chaperone function